MRRWMFILCALCTLSFVAGCGSSATSPGLGAATISGSIIGSASSSSTSTNLAPSSGVGVSVPGNKATATVDTNGSFTLNGVAPGEDVQVRFSGGGLNTQVSVGKVSASERVTATFVREGNTVKLDCVRHDGEDREELEGRIDGLPPSTPAGTFTISGQSVQTNADTKFEKGDTAATFADLALGMRVHVKGTPNATGVLAKIVRIQNTNTDLSVHLEGPIANVMGTAAAFQFTINGRLVKGDATTVLEVGTTVGNLLNGVRVEVKGVMKDGFVFATKIEIE